MLGLVGSFFWILDTINKIFILQKPYQMIWYSSMGLLFTTIGLFKKNSLLLTSMFCALLLLESFWLISYFSTVLFHHTFTPFADYAFSPAFPKFESFTTLYHILLVPSVIYALIKLKKIHPLGFLGAFAFATSLALISTKIVPPSDNVNCIYAPCEGLFTRLYLYPNPLRILIATFSLTLYVYLPFNRVALNLSRKLKWDKIKDNAAIKFYSAAEAPL